VVQPDARRGSEPVLLAILQVAGARKRGKSAVVFSQPAPGARFALGLVRRVGILYGHEALQGLPREGRDMTIGVGNIVALVCIVISIVFAIITNQATNAVWWALLAIFAVLWWEVRAPWGR